MVSIQKEFENDLKFIDRELIAKQPDGRYCKFSRILNAVAIYNMPESQYINYWKSQYLKDEERCKKIIEKCKNKLMKNLIPVKRMVRMIEKSDDCESEKKNAINALLGIKNKGEKEND